MNRFMNHRHSFAFRKPSGEKRTGDEFALSAQMMISRAWQVMDRTHLLLHPPQPKSEGAHLTAQRPSTPFRGLSNQL
jgi:hypothetical protein